MNLIDIKRKGVGLAAAAALFMAAPSHSFANDSVPFNDTQKQHMLIAQSADDEDDVNDPLESINRSIFEFNDFIQTYFLNPVADLYNDNLPAVFRSGVSNFLTNLATPVTVANQLLQGDPEQALLSVGKFMANTIVGIGGLADVAGELGHPVRSEDFGQTLGVWGVEEGFYLVLPIFGPSSPRDVIGKFIVDPYFDASGNWISNTDRDAMDWSLKVVDGVSEYAGVADDLRQIRKTSVDYYAAIRSLYRQKRKSEINNGEQLELPPIPDLGYDMSPATFDSTIAGTN